GARAPPSLPNSDPNVTPANASVWRSPLADEDLQCRSLSRELSHCGDPPFSRARIAAGATARAALGRMPQVETQASSSTAVCSRLEQLHEIAGWILDQNL